MTDIYCSEYLLFVPICEDIPMYSFSSQLDLVGIPVGIMTIGTLVT